MEEPGPGHDTGAVDDELDAASSTGKHRGKGSMDIPGHVSKSVQAAEIRAGRDGDPGDPNAPNPTLGQHGVPDGHRGEL